METACLQRLNQTAAAGLGISCSAPRLAVEREQAELNDTDRATARTVRKMVEHIAAGSADAEVIRSAGESQVYLPADASRYARAWCWWHWVKSHLAFRSDDTAIFELLGETEQLELLISPAVMVRLAEPQGDCDDFTMLVCAGLLALGVPCQIVTVAAGSDEPERFSHVYARAEVGPGRFLTMDTSHGSGPGWEVPVERQYRRVVWDMSGSPVEVDAMGGFKGLHGYDHRALVPAESVARRNMGAGASLMVPAGLPMPFGRVHLRRRGVGDAVTGSTAEAPGSWQDVFQSLALTGGEILKQQLSPLAPGEYVQTATGVRSRGVPGAIPGQYPGTGVNLGGAGFSMGTILLVVGAGAALLFAMKGRR